MKSAKVKKPREAPVDYLATIGEWGPSKYGINVVIDSETSLANLGPNVVLDVEDNEAGTFVGVGLYDGGKSVLYFTCLTDTLNEAISRYRLIAHNGKSDFHKLKNWGVNIRAEQLVFDTMVAAYVISSTRESYGLKDLARQEIGVVYPSYRDIVRTGRTKTTLDKHPVSLVAAYNGMDVIASYRLWQLYDKTFTAAQRTYYETLELPVTRLLYEMEEEGIKADENYLAVLDRRFTVLGDGLLQKLRRACGQNFNPNSPKQVVGDLLRGKLGLSATASNKEALKDLADIPLVQVLTRFREVAKLSGTYTGPLLELAKGDVNARIHTTFNQVAVLANGDTRGIRTGRLSSSEPNLHNIPTRTETGNLLRRAFISKEGHEFVCADYSQIEWRLAAHFSEDPHMCQVIRDGKDIYDVLAAQVGCSRAVAKTMALAMNFGAGVYKIAYVLKVPEYRAFQLVDGYKDTFPKFFKWRYKIEAQQFVTTILGRQIKPEKDSLKVPYLIQGSAADIIKKAMLTVSKIGFRPLLQVHDELLFEVHGALLGAPESALFNIKACMETIVPLHVPLQAKVGFGRTWDAAK